jgi:hypothetical protein
MRATAIAKTANRKPPCLKPNPLPLRKKNIRVKDPEESAAGSVGILLISANVWAAPAARWAAPARNGLKRVCLWDPHNAAEPGAQGLVEKRETSMLAN